MILSSMKEWADANGIREDMSPVPPPIISLAVPGVCYGKETTPARRAMTAEEKTVAAALCPGRVNYPVASPPKRLGNSLAYQAEHGATITDRQAVAMWRQAWRFRRQLPCEVVEIVKRHIQDGAGSEA